MSLTVAVQTLPEDYWQTLPLGRGVALIARDTNGLVAFSKPAGTLSHPNESRDQPRALLTTRYVADGEYYEWNVVNAERGMRNAELRTGKNAPVKHTPLAAAHSALRTPHSAFVPVPRRLWLLNRLDSATSGVILAASTEKLASEIRALFQKRHISKIYAALVFGHPSEKAQVWRDKLAVQKRGGQIRTAAVGNIPAEAHMTFLHSRRDATGSGEALAISLIRLEPKTGRSHQLRVQCARRHLPIVGDATYGDFRANRDYAKRTGEKRLFLHSLETRFDYEFEGRKYTFSAKAELPDEFGA